MIEPGADASFTNSSAFYFKRAIFHPGNIKYTHYNSINSSINEHNSRHWKYSFLGKKADLIKYIT
ncbi:hypothetical protein JCM21738_407 [Mesobacillus boroniphilus JCM 21738]|uniref:Uncharacterized protein n=1 Tax=Mesobacillus boroniphilus JCM 21738 TaxID=1294265 RepID=W4RH42_9BACI|nr:hypothetical protein JCM21738_407 [Mesobacillus boroniphilus JCM 21738]